MEDVSYYARRAEEAALEARRAASEARSESRKAVEASSGSRRTVETSHDVRRAEEAALEARRAVNDIKELKNVITEEINNLRADLEVARLREVEYLKTIKELTLKTVNLERSLLKQLEKTQQIVTNNTNIMIKNCSFESTQMIQKECSPKSEPVVEQLGTTTVYSKINH